MGKILYTGLFNSFKHLNNLYRSYSVCNYDAIKNMPCTQSALLSNGLLVATEERQSPNMCIGLFIDAGTRFEKQNENGMTHLFEHLAFKGTTCKSKAEIESLMTNTGAKFGCYTSRDLVEFTVECLTEDFHLVLGVLLECIFRNAYSESEFQMQKNIVYQEMLKQDTNTNDVIFDYLHSSAFQGTPLAQTVMGTSTNLHHMKVHSVCSFINKIFRPHRCMLAVVGNVKHDDVIRFGNEYFPREDKETSFAIGPRRYTGSQILYRDDSMEVANVAIAVEGPRFCSNDRIVLELASTVLGGWDKSQPGGIDHGTRLARAASIEGFCDSYKAFNIFYRDTGLWGVHFVSPKLMVDDMVLMIQDEWMRLCNTITYNELIQAKQELKSKIISTIESASESCRELGKWGMYTGQRPSVEERFNIIERISTDYFREVCTKYIYDRCPVVVGAGATECLPDYSRIRAGMYWLRV